MRRRDPGPHYDPILTELVPPRVELSSQWLAESDPRESMEFNLVAYTPEEAIAMWRSGYRQAVEIAAIPQPWVRDSLPSLLVFFLALVLLSALMRLVGLIGGLGCFG